ncbi:MAG TPA: MqnA/MqnD/SBP family protein [candidate division Zixibacteria bacterium]|nr:MqnA/MqnD/SBP family protein [candidate division Zixibacteria bacterium]
MDIRYLPSGERRAEVARAWAGIKFLNAYPLLRNLEDDLQGWSRVIAAPSECASLLDAGKVDLAQVPLITAVVNNWPFLGEIGIACNGPVTSVKLIYHRDLKILESYRPDPASGTSNILARLWYNLEYGRDLTPDAKSDDAEIVIGDRAFEADTAEQIDLGAAWRRETGLPFVFGVWAARDEKLLSAVAPTLIARLERNLMETDALVSDASRLTGKLINVRRYLYQSLHYRLGERDHLGMHTFIDLAYKYDLIPTRAMRMILSEPARTV